MKKTLSPAPKPVLTVLGQSDGKVDVRRHGDLTPSELRIAEGLADDLRRLFSSGSTSPENTR